MNSKVIAMIVGALVIVGGGAWWLLSQTNSPAKTSQSTTNTTTNPTATPSAPKLLAQTVGQQADCSTYTFSELGTIWGVPFTDTDINKVSELSTEGGKLYSCAYNETDSGQGVTVTVEYREHKDEASAKQSMNDTRSTEKYGDTVYYTKEDRAGVGDEAFLWARYRTDGSKEVNQQLYVRKGNVVFLLSGVNLAGVDASYKDKLITTYKLHFN